MKPHRFAYADPATTLEALDLLGEWGDEAKVLAGGQSLMPLLNMRLSRPEWLVDLRRVTSLRYIEDDAGEVRLGAMTTYTTLEQAAPAAAGAVLPRAVPFVGHRAIRNRGTIGGAIAHADPAAELPAALLAARGSVVATSRSDSRLLPADAFFVMPFTTVLEPDELLVEVRLPRWPPRTGSAVVELSQRSGDFAIAGVVAVLSVDEQGRFEDVSLSAFGVDSTPVALPQASAAAVGASAIDAELLVEAGEVGAGEIHPADDLHAPATYRREVLPALVRRALTDAAAEARGRTHERSNDG